MTENDVNTDRGKVKDIQRRKQPKGKEAYLFDKYWNISINIKNKYFHLHWNCILHMAILLSKMSRNYTLLSFELLCNWTKRNKAKIMMSDIYQVLTIFQASHALSLSILMAALLSISIFCDSSIA